MFYKANIRTYNTVMKPEDCTIRNAVILNKKGEMRELKRKEKSLGRSLDRKKRKCGTWRKRKINIYINKYNCVKNSDITRNRRLGVHKNESRLTKQIFSCITQINATTKWVEKTKIYMLELGIDPTGSGKSILLRLK